MKRWQRIALNCVAVIAVAMLVWFDPGYVVSGVDVLGWTTEILFALLLGYGAVALGRLVERNTGKPLLGIPNPLGAAIVTVPVAVLLHLGLQLVKHYPLALYFDLRFGVFVAVAAYAVNRLWSEENIPAFEFLAAGRRASLKRTDEKGRTIQSELITVRRRVGDVLRDVGIDARRHGWAVDPASRGTSWSRLQPSGAKDTVTVSPGFFAIDGTSQGSLDGAAQVSDPGSWSTVVFTTEPAVAPSVNPYV